MMIFNQDGTALYNFDNAMCLKVVGEKIKLVLKNTLIVADEEKFPNIVVAEYGSNEEAVKALETIMPIIALSSAKLVQLPRRKDAL